MESLTKLLVVEDNADDTFLLNRQLMRAQIDDCVTVTNGADSLKFLLEASPLPLAVFLDLSLPGMSGLDVLRAMKKDEKLKDLPVIVMTGSLRQADVDECTRLGATAYLTKPIGLSTFIKTVTHLFPKAATAS